MEDLRNQIHLNKGGTVSAIESVFTNWLDNDSDMINRWVNLNANYARIIDLRRIIKYYENNKERNMKDFLNEFQEYSGY